MLSRSLQRAAILLALGLAVTSNLAHASTNVISGTVKKVDTGSKTIAVETADGTTKTVKFTAHTSVRGLEAAGRASDLAGKEGGHVIVHTSGETAHSVQWLGDKTIHATEGTVEDAGKASKVVTVKSADGAKETFRVADHATVDTGKRLGRYSAIGAKKGEHVTVYYTEEAGKKVAHLFRRAF